MPSPTANFVAEALFDLELLGVHLARMGEEIVLWSTKNSASARSTTRTRPAAPMLPQKKNPDVAELARGKAGPPDRTSQRDLVTLKGLAARLQPRPAGGQGAALRRGAPGLTRSPCGAASTKTASWNEERMQAAADGQAASAIDLAEYLVGTGDAVPPGARVVGGLVRELLERHVPLVELVAATPTSARRPSSSWSPGWP